MLRNVTITLEEEALRWARHQAAEKGISVSKFVGQMIERQSGRRGPEYWKAFEEWKKLSSTGMDIDAANRLSREEVHERRR